MYFSSYLLQQNRNSMADDSFSDKSEFYDTEYVDYFRQHIPNMITMIEEELNSQTMPLNPIKFDEKHVEYLIRKFDSNPQGFPLHLSRVFKKLLKTRWITVKYLFSF